MSGQDGVGWDHRQGSVISAIERREMKGKDPGVTAGFQSDLKIKHNSVLESCLS